MRSQLTLFLDPLIGLYVLTFALRLGMQWVRADFRNPIVQFVLKVTNPLVIPFRQFIPPFRKLDTATLIVYILLCWATMGILLSLECFLMPDILTTLALAILYSIRLLLNTYTFIIIGYVVLSWISQGNYNPSLIMLSSLLRSLAQPVLAPVQRVIPPIGGLDLSPIIILITLPAVTQMLLKQGYRIAEGFNCGLNAIL
ncbi:MAG: YggT family protein [Gammaproteobacteria bacterium]|nr:YggT family protein [Gammaproteobacteria bacterium]MCP4091595.1 YggT family protein [Gammaproteobacteria bacterium]MCP4276091.1 YggT family protein [Gammaproteobacteria bacterium]MCP4832583.1 YggT family protein [Gammaproteobacteria bacterium]MCP4929661.1 YggT family protein [Gammaproteobacteria bacterium]